LTNQARKAQEDISDQRLLADSSLDLHPPVSSPRGVLTGRRKRRPYFFASLAVIGANLKSVALI
jgi:hypothetical protein